MGFNSAFKGLSYRNNLNFLFFPPQFYSASWYYHVFNYPTECTTRLVYKIVKTYIKTYIKMPLHVSLLSCFAKVIIIKINS